MLCSVAACLITSSKDSAMRVFGGMYPSVMKKTRVSGTTSGAAAALQQANSRTSRKPSTRAAHALGKPGPSCKAHSRKSAPRCEAGSSFSWSSWHQGTVGGLDACRPSIARRHAASNPERKQVPRRTPSVWTAAWSLSAAPSAPAGREAADSTLTVLAKVRTAAASSGLSRSSALPSAAFAASSLLGPEASSANGYAMLPLTSRAKIRLQGARPWAWRPGPSYREFSATVSHVSTSPETGSRELTSRHRGPTRLRVRPVSK
mmetsp:Transcript_183604/g.446990  ORF Transcript_183604/g.446990 Transcript_183604/m.446990 type:complete len:261 (-) Transcript_183604:15-797(-)